MLFFYLFIIFRVLGVVANNAKPYRSEMMNSSLNDGAMKAMILIVFAGLLSILYH